MACAALKSGLYFLKMLQNRNLYHEDQHGAKLKFAYRRATVISLCTNSSAKFSKPNTNFWCNGESPPLRTPAKNPHQNISPKTTFSSPKSIEKALHSANPPPPKKYTKIVNFYKNVIYIRCKFAKKQVSRKSTLFVSEISKCSVLRKKLCIQIVGCSHDYPILIQTQGVTVTPVSPCVRTSFG